MPISIFDIKLPVSTFHALQKVRAGVTRLLLAAMCCAVMVSCGGIESSANRLEKQVARQAQTAIGMTEKVVDCLQASSVDSLLSLTTENKQVLFFVFNDHRMVYWSQNRLSGAQVHLTNYDRWYYQLFDNAHCICRWTRADGYNVLTVLPIKYNYAFENEQLRNVYVEPFDLPADIDISRTMRDDGVAVNAPEGNFLFCLYKRGTQPAREIDKSKLGESFSFWKLTQSGESHSERSSALASISWFVLLMVLLCLVLVALGIYGLWYARGFRNMRLRTKLMYVFTALQLVSFIYVFFVSASTVRQRYEQRQRADLQAKTRYIQKALQESYFWAVHLSERKSSNLNVDLRDLSYTYETDIHVYDMAGNLVGTSAPALFDYGLLSRHLSPEAIFSDNPNVLQSEQIGELTYLSAYTEFFNGNYMQIGYIAVPLFISSDELESEMNEYLARLFPPYLIVLLLTVVLSFFIARGLTHPLDTLSDRMRHFRIGQSNNYLDYSSKDEVGQLVARYNEMVGELERSAERLARSEREGAWRTMARQIAHEINNPLTPMKLTIQQLQRMKGTERFDEYFRRSTTLLIEQIDNLSRIASSFSTFAKMPEVVPTTVDVAEKLFPVISLFRNNRLQVPVRYVGAEHGVTAVADAEQISQVFSNLIKNALQAVEDLPDGDVIVMLKPQTEFGEDMKEWVEITVSDNGKGIDESVRDKIFMPNFTTKSTGTGLGLAISKNIVEGSGGRITFETSEKGTTFHVYLQAAKES